MFTHQQRDHLDGDSLHAVLDAALLQAAVQAVERVPGGELRGDSRHVSGTNTDGHRLNSQAAVS